MTVWLLAVALAAEPPWSTLLTDDGWEPAATPSTPETGKIDLRTKVIDGVTCLRGEARVDVTPDALWSVAGDIAAAPSFSSEKILRSEVLSRKGQVQEYVQVIDLPGWTMANDRFWVIRGEALQEGEDRSFRWQRFDWRPAYPELAAQLASDHPDAVEPDTNWGAWQIHPSERGSRVRYHLCTVAGGSVPPWIQKAAASRSLPSAMADIVREAGRRARD